MSIHHQVIGRKSSPEKRAAARVNGLLGGSRPALWLSVEDEDFPPVGRLGKRGSPLGVVDVRRDGQSISAMVGGELYAADCPEWPARGVYVLRHQGRKRLAKRIARAPSIVVSRTVVDAPAPVPTVSAPAEWKPVMGPMLPGAETPLQDPPGVVPVGPWSETFTREDEVLRLMRCGMDDVHPDCPAYLMALNDYMREAK